MMFRRLQKPLSLLSVLAALAIGTGCQTQSLKQSLATHTQSQPAKLSQADIDTLCSNQQENLFSEPDFDDLWDRMRAGFQLQHPVNTRTQKHLEWYKKHPNYIKRVSERGSIFWYHIVEELEKRDMPLELALLPIVESAFDPFAYSHGRASGMWQFIPGTGKHYGLKQNWWYDGRRDAIASTDAALTYLSRLHKSFDGDWLLALAAYNTGAGNVRKAIRRNKKAGKPTDFWSLKLPRETRAYVPQLLALAELADYPQKHGLELIRIANKPHFKQIDIGSQIDLAQAADMAGISIDELYRLNAGFNRWATDPKGPHRLLIPITHADTFEQALNDLPPKARTAWVRHKIKSGDSLIGIAKQYKTSVATLKDVNNIRGNMIRQGQTLMIPVASQPAKHYAYSEEQRVMRKQARSQGKSGTRKITYQVKAGDSFWKIAQQYGVTVSSLAKWNAMAPKDTLKQGQQLVVWASENKIRNARKTPTMSPVIRKVAYKVRNGDSLARIAGKFNLSVNDIVRWNPVKKSGYIHPGQSLTLFVDVTGAR